MAEISLLNWFSLAWFLSCWVTYTKFAKYRAQTSASLSSVMNVHRVNWMRRLLQREVRVSDASLLGNLERNVNFFASSCVLILAGLLTALTAAEQVVEMLAGVTFAIADTVLAVELKLVTLIGIYTYGFFTFTWSMRQFGFACVLVGAAPLPTDTTVTPAERRSFAKYSAKVIDQASRSYNFGLRAFYFSLAVLAWFIHPLYFIAASALVTFVLYYREFRSNTVDALLKVEGVGAKMFNIELEQE